jgi:hypothetical protein
MTTLDLVNTDVSGVVVVVLVDYLRQYRSWGWMRLVAGPTAIKRWAAAMAVVLAFAPVLRTKV